MIPPQLYEVKTKLIAFETKMQSSRFSHREAEDMLEYIASQVCVIFRGAQHIINTQLGTDSKDTPKVLINSLVEANEVCSRVRKGCMTDAIDLLDKKIQILLKKPASKIDLQEIRTLRKKIEILFQCSPSQEQINRLNQWKTQIENKSREEHPACPCDIANPPLIPLGMGVCGLSNEVLQICFGYCDKPALSQVDSHFNDVNTGLYAHYWAQLRLSPPQGLLDIASLMTSIELRFPNKPLVWFKELQKEFVSEGAVLPQGRLSVTATDFEALQKQIEKKYNDQALVAIWGKISPQLQAPPVLATAEEIRQWMNNPANAVHLNGVIGLDLDSLNLRVLPSEIEKLTQLQTLILSRNKLTSLPDSLGNLTSLRQLFLFDNQLASLPDSLGNLNSLHLLYLYNNQLVSLPDSFGNLRSLQQLHLYNNQLVSLPDSFGNLSLLQGLHLSDNKLTSIPDSFCYLSFLQGLSLFNNQLISLPDSFGSLFRLQTLGLSNNPLASLPASIGNLRSLHMLDLSNNQLASLPASIGDLSSLRVIKLSRNQLVFLPDSFGNLTQLTELYLFGNALLFIPDIVVNSTNPVIKNHPQVVNFKESTTYQSSSNFAKLYQSILQRKSKEQIQSLFYSLAPADRNLIFEMVWLGAGSPKTEDLQWGEHHVFGDPIRFFHAVRHAISMKLERLSQDQKDQVYGNIYRLAGNPATKDGRWGEHHALINLSRLADAMDSCV